MSEFAAAAAIAGLRDRAVGLGRLFTLRPVLWIGARSYAIYLWHYPLIIFGREYGRVGVLAAVALAVLAAAVSWRVVEQPFLLLKRRFEPTMPKHAARGRPVWTAASSQPFHQDAVPPAYSGTPSE